MPRRGVNVVPLPGPCAVITALSASGLPSDRFSFEGFLPPKSKGRRDKFAEIAEDERTLIFYESTHRIHDALEDMVAVLGPDRQVVLARELTKTYETIHGAPLAELIEWLKQDSNRTKGEMVLLVAGHRPEKDALPTEACKALGLLANELPLKRQRLSLQNSIRLKRTHFINGDSIIFPLLKVKGSGRLRFSI